MKIEIPFSGHSNILSLHKKTIEITKDSHLTINGDCIIGVNANLACIDLPEKFKKRYKIQIQKLYSQLKLAHILLLFMERDQKNQHHRVVQYRNHERTAAFP